MFLINWFKETSHTIKQFSLAFANLIKSLQRLKTISTEAQTTVDEITHRVNRFEIENVAHFERLAYLQNKLQKDLEHLEKH